MHTQKSWAAIAQNDDSPNSSCYGDGITHGIGESIDAEGFAV